MFSHLTYESHDPGLLAAVTPDGQIPAEPDLGRTKGPGQASGDVVQRKEYLAGSHRLEKRQSWTHDVIPQARCYHGRKKGHISSSFSNCTA